ncbi:MAG: hypothetical protein R3335_08245, partial [Anaerolineales bacterium]|nr:hypothetical protein [Anaerolineales bacterium]
MDEKSLQVLEYHKVLARLAGYCAFSASVEQAEALRPSTDYLESLRMQAQTGEARRLLESSPGTGVGGARDVRPQVEAASRGGVLLPTDLLDVKGTLVSARNLGRLFDRQQSEYPHLAEIAADFPEPTGLVDAISRTVSDRGEVLDSASERLRAVRAELRQVHDRLLARLQKMVSSPNVAPYLQENLVTQRDGRYVIPLRAEFKGKVKAIVHDQSASGATLFIEPLSVVEQNNRYRELQLAERDEEQRVLAELSGRIGAHAKDLTALVDTLAALDLVFAKAQYADHLEATEPTLHPMRGARAPTSPDARLPTSPDARAPTSPDARL